jgi:flagellar basal body-associated protein FliL
VLLQSATHKQTKKMVVTCIIRNIFLLLIAFDLLSTSKFVFADSKVKDESLWNGFTNAEAVTSKVGERVTSFVEGKSSDIVKQIDATIDSVNEAKKKLIEGGREVQAQVKEKM